MEAILCIFLLFHDEKTHLCTVVNSGSSFLVLMNNKIFIYTKVSFSRNLVILPNLYLHSSCHKVNLN